MINVEMTVREAVALAIHTNAEMYERIIHALEAKCGELKAVMTVRHVPRDNFIPCIKVIRSHLGWELRETKDFFDIVRGGSANSITNHSDIIIKLASELRSQGCVVDIKDAERKSL